MARGGNARHSSDGGGIVSDLSYWWANWQTKGATK